MQEALDAFTQLTHIRPRWISGCDRFVFMHPRTGTLYYLSSSRYTFVTFATSSDHYGITLHTLADPEPWEVSSLTCIPDELCELPDHHDEFPFRSGINYTTPMYGQLTLWREFAQRRWTQDAGGSSTAVAASSGGRAGEAAPVFRDWAIRVVRS